MKKLLGLSLALLTAFNLASAENFELNKDYFKLEQPIESLDNQVLEFFSYKCAYCFRAERSVEVLKDNLPEGVELLKIPVTLGYVQLEPLSYAALLLKEFGLGDEYHNHMYYVVQAPLEDEKALYNSLENEENVKAFFLKQGISEERYNKALAKLKKQKLVKAADKKASKFKVSGTPTFIINGKYKVYGFDSKVGYHKDMGKLLTYLVNLK